VAQDHPGASCLGRAIKVKGSYLQAQFHRPRARRGAKKAIVALAASMLTAAAARRHRKARLGAAHFERANATKPANRLIIRRLQEIDYTIHASLCSLGLSHTPRRKRRGGSLESKVSQNLKASTCPPGTQG
jgi:hypothetical protein